MSTYFFGGEKGGGGGGGGSNRAVDQAPFAEAWRILLRNHLNGVSIQGDVDERRIYLIRKWLTKANKSKSLASW